MHLEFRNVNDAFRYLVTEFGVRSPKIAQSSSRVGDVLYITEPVTITYTHPRERVLFNQARDANPFFHVYEALWMLAGRNDIQGPAYYAPNYRQCVQDGDCPTANGAYGYRWRHARCDSAEDTEISEAYLRWPKGLEIDQLKVIIEHLKTNPTSRRAVLQIWNVEDDLLKIGSICTGDDPSKPKYCMAPTGSKDVCCNTHAYFSLREVIKELRADGWSEQGEAIYGKVLDMTVCNRSNDLIWGMLGANVVHFSMLQEYLAACLGVDIGVYNQFTNNLHVYTERFKPKEWLEDGYSRQGASVVYDSAFTRDGTSFRDIKLVPLVKNPAMFDREVQEFAERHKQDALAGEYTEPFLRDVAQPMCIAFHHYKHKDFGNALSAAEHIQADDWHIAATSWLQKRRERHGQRQSNDNA